MSGVPPNIPPGGVPPYDPKTQWRIYREQQRAAWRSQRDAWRAQRHAWKANDWGAYGPRVPSVVGPIILVAIGVVGLLLYSGRISGPQFWSWYGHWWPLLLIGAGLALLGEWVLDLRRSAPVRRGGSYVGLLILVAIVGIFAAGWSHMRPWIGPWHGNNGDFFNFFGLPEHDSDQQAMSQPVPANATVEIEDPRGDISITAGDTPNVQVQAHEIAFADSNASASRIFEAEAAHLTVNGASAVVQCNGNDHGRVNLTVTVPKMARVTVNSQRGDVTAAGMGAGITINSARGDTHLNGVTGPIVAHFSNGRHDFSAHQVSGDLTADGNCNDLTLSDFKGRITVNGDIFGDVHMENIAGPVTLHTSVTNLELASLPGDLTLDSDDLRVTEAQGAVHVTTHAKDVDLSEIYGDTSVDDRDGTVSIEPAGAYGIEVRNGKGDVEITLPPNATGTIDGHTHNGDIVTDYGLNISGDEDKTVSGTIGAGGPRILLSADEGDVRIKKGPAFPATPPAPAAEAANPAAPAIARHLRPPKTPPQQPVTQ
jgi:DUF4097 and DUF4098 domain-containing protein YvlB